MPRLDTASRIAEIMVQRLRAGQSTEQATLRRLGFTQADIDAHGPAAIARARRQARHLGLDLGEAAIADSDPLAA